MDNTMIIIQFFTKKFNSVIKPYNLNFSLELISNINIYVHV